MKQQFIVEQNIVFFKHLFHFDAVFLSVHNQTQNKHLVYPQNHSLRFLLLKVFLAN